jgi:hypothetical protein
MYFTVGAIAFSLVGIMSVAFTMLFTALLPTTAVSDNRLGRVLLIAIAAKLYLLLASVVLDQMAVILMELFKSDVFLLKFRTRIATAIHLLVHRHEISFIARGENLAHESRRREAELYVGPEFDRWNLVLTDFIVPGIMELSTIGNFLYYGIRTSSMLEAIIGYVVGDSFV